MKPGNQAKLNLPQPQNQLQRHFQIFEEVLGGAPRLRETLPTISRLTLCHWTGQSHWPKWLPAAQQMLQLCPKLGATPTFTASIRSIQNGKTRLHLTSGMDIFLQGIPSQYYSTLLYSSLLYSTLLYFSLLRSTLLYYSLLYSTPLCSTLRYSTVLYSTVLYASLLYFAGPHNLLARMDSHAFACFITTRLLLTWLPKLAVEQIAVPLLHTFGNNYVRRESRWWCNHVFRPYAISSSLNAMFSTLASQQRFDCIKQFYILVCVSSFCQTKFS